MYMYTYIYIYIRMYVYIYIHVHTLYVYIYIPSSMEVLPRVAHTEAVEALGPGWHSHRKGGGHELSSWLEKQRRFLRQIRQEE